MHTPFFCRAGTAALLVTLISGCRISSPPVVDSSEAPAATPQAAVDGFVSAVASRDVKRVGALWGTRDGLLRDRISPVELETRVGVIACYLGTSHFTTVGMMPDTADGVLATLKSADNKRTERVRAIKGQEGQWIVESLAMRKLDAGSC